MPPLMNEQYLFMNGFYRAALSPLSADQAAGHFSHPLFGAEQHRPNVTQNALFFLTFAVHFGQTMIFCICQLIVNSLICQEFCSVIIAAHLILRFNSLLDVRFFRVRNY